MDEIGKLLSAVRTEFGWGGVLVALMAGGLIWLAWYWQTKSGDGAKAAVKNSGNSQSTAHGGAGGTASGGNASATGNVVNINLQPWASQAPGVPADGPPRFSSADVSEVDPVISVTLAPGRDAVLVVGASGLTPIPAQLQFKMFSQAKWSDRMPIQCYGEQ